MKHPITQTEMLGLYRKMLTIISKLKLHNITVDLIFKTSPEGYYFSITVFDRDRDNRTFYAYLFLTFEELNNEMFRLAAAIKSDDFNRILELKEAAESAAHSKVHDAIAEGRKARRGAI